MHGNSLKTCLGSLKNIVIVENNAFEREPNPQNGMVLLIVLFWIALLQIVALSNVHQSILRIRSLHGHEDMIQARHAAHAANVFCSTLLEQGQITIHPWNKNTPPAYWHAPEAFEGRYPVAQAIASSWPPAIRPPQCLVESWTLPTQSKSPFYWITAKGFGSTEEAVAWEQTIKWKEAKNSEGSQTDEEIWRHAERPLLPL